MGIVCEGRFGRGAWCSSIAAIACALAAAAPAQGGGPASNPDLARDDDIAIVRGSWLSEFFGLPVDEITLFRFDPSSGGFVPIPFQVDERLDVRFNEGTPLEFVEPRMYDVLHLDDGLFDDQDEIVFLFDDAGPQAASGAAWPAGAGSVRYETMARDPRDGAEEATRWVYAYSGANLPRSGTAYIAWNSTATGSISTPDFTLDFSGNWLLTGYRVASPCGSGADLLDRLKIRSNPLGYPAVDEQVLNLNSEYLGGIVGPVRAIRYVKGAKSGVNTIHFDRVSRHYWRRDVHLRVHPIESFDVYFDWRPRSNAWLYREGMSSPVAIDGIPDPGVPSSFAAWNLVSGPGGGIFVSFDLPSSSLYAEKRAFHRDDAAYNDAPAGSGSYPDEDDSAYGDNGLTTVGVADCNYEPLSFSFRVEPLCSGEGGLSLALAHFELVEEPLEIEAEPQTAALGALRTLALSVDGSDVVLQWSALPGAESYRVYSSLSPDEPHYTWTMEEQVSEACYRDEGEAGRTGLKGYSVVGVTENGAEGPW